MNYTYDDKDRPFYERVYDILSEHAGAPKTVMDKESFVRSFTQREYKATEYRCCGEFGFGGKFWRNGGRFYVSCYSEDKTPKMDKQITKVNELLEALATEMKPAPYGPV